MPHLNGQPPPKAGGRLGPACAAALLLSCVLGAAMAQAQTQADDCDRAAWPLASERARLAAPALHGVESGGDLALPLSQGTMLRLLPRADARLPHPPSRDGAAPQAAFLRLKVPGPEGVWQITVAAPAWIDVFVNGQAVAPVAFTGVHACAGVRKSLRFPLPPGEAVLEISSATGEGIALLVERVAP